MKRQHVERVRLIPFLTFGFSFILLFVCLTSSAQTIPPITSSGLNTQVSPPATLSSGKVQYDITGGTRPGGGGNLFHSFGDFNVPTNHIANFLNDTPNLATSNILGRVTGGNLSNIFGTIQTTGFGNANLFLINPAGFLFGPNATVNVGGMVTFTTADYIRHTDNMRFNAVSGPADALLTAEPVAAFGFLGSNPGAITVQGSQFTVANGTGISLVGGNITIQSGTPEGGTAQPARLSAPNGKIQLASAASPGEFDAATLQPLPNVNNASFTSFGSASLAPGATINVSDGQTVSIRGGQFVISVNDSVLSTAQSPGPPETISLSPGSSILSSNAGPDAGADVQLLASNVQMEDASIQSLTTGAGEGGDISITALDGGPNSSTGGSVQMKGGQIQTASLGPGTVGDIQINSGSLSMTDGALIDTLLAPNPLIPGQPGGGTIAITATDSIVVSGQRTGNFSFFPAVPAVPQFTNILSGFYSENLSANPGSDVVVQTPRLTLQPGTFRSDTYSAGAAGNMTFLLEQLTLKDGGFISSGSFGTGASGAIQIRATESITMSGFLPGTRSIGPLVLQNTGSAITSPTFGLGEGGPISVSTSILTMNGASISSSSRVSPGGGGDVEIQAAIITLTGGAVIDSSTRGSGQGGTVSVTASEQLSISGHRSQSTSFGTRSTETVVSNPSTIDALTFGPGHAGHITVRTPSLVMFDGGLITTGTGGDGSAGSITINAGSINLSSGASISSSSGINTGTAAGFLFGNGAGGTVTVNATGLVTMADQGSGLFTTTVGNGAGGNINLRGSAIQLSDGASISATSAGRGNAGNITINAGSQFTMINSSITTEAHQSSGGAIKITTTPSGAVQLTDSTISASVLDGTGGGGSVNIDPEFVILQNSQILANAVFGPRGNINLTTNLLLPDSASIISASSQFGQQGTISIQSPISPASGKIFPLSQKPLIETSLMSQRCAASAEGIYSSFTVAGRDNLPAEPGGWISSPLALASTGMVGGTVTEPDTRTSVSDPAGETPLLSLRRIAPPGFLTQSFATDSLTDCAS